MRTLCLLFWNVVFSNWQVRLMTSYPRNWRCPTTTRWRHTRWRHQRAAHLACRESASRGRRAANRSLCRLSRVVTWRRTRAPAVTASFPWQRRMAQAAVLECRPTECFLVSNPTREWGHSRTGKRFLHYANFNIAKFLKPSRRKLLYFSTKCSLSGQIHV